MHMNLGWLTPVKNPSLGKLCRVMPNTVTITQTRPRRDILSSQLKATHCHRFLLSGVDRPYQVCVTQEIHTPKGNEQWIQPGCPVQGQQLLFLYLWHHFSQGPR